MASTETSSGRLPGRLKALLLPLLLFVGVFSVYWATAERAGVNVDAYAASAGAWRLATAESPWFDDLDVKKIEGTHKDRGVNRNGQWISESPNGHVTVQRMPGPIISGVPFYWLLGDSGTSEADFTLDPAAVAASSMSALAVMLIFLALRRSASTPLALVAALVFAFATPTWTISANGLWTHTVTQLGIAGAAFGASRGRWWLSGMFLGIGMLGRPHLALIAAVLGLGVAWSRRDVRIALRLAIPTVTSLALLAAWNRAVHGQWSLAGSFTYAVGNAAEGFSGNGLRQLLTNYVGFLISFNRGLLIWTPILLLFIPAILRARKALPDWSVWLALGGVVYTFFQLRINEFSGGIFFYGYRHGLEMLTAWMPALCFSAPYLGKLARRLAPILIALQVAAMMIGALVEGFFVRPSLVWRENSFWLALRFNPEVVGGWLALLLFIGILVAVRFVPSPLTGQPQGTQTKANEARQ